MFHNFYNANNNSTTIQCAQTRRKIVKCENFVLKHYVFSLSASHTTLTPNLSAVESTWKHLSLNDFVSQCWAFEEWSSLNVRAQKVGRKKLFFISFSENLGLNLDKTVSKLFLKYQKSKLVRIRATFNSILVENLKKNFLCFLKLRKMMMEEWKNVKKKILSRKKRKKKWRRRI